MAPGDPEKYQTSLTGDAHAKLLYNSLEQYNKAQKKTRRPSVILAALICLFLSAAGGLALAVVLIVHPLEIEATCLPRDLILFASCMSLLYTGLHIRGARKDYVRNGPAPPQSYGNYLHASALLIARLSIAVWIAALIATAVVISKALRLEGFAGKVPFLDLLICIGAIPSFIIISITIEKHATPFATTAISRNSFLTCRVSEFADDLVEDLSVSRRASIQRKQSQNGSILTVPTEDIFRLAMAQPHEFSQSRDADARARTPVVVVTDDERAADDRTELMANSPIRPTHHDIPAVPKIPAVHSPPEPAYNPGGWRAAWSASAEEAGGAPLSPRDDPSSSSQTTTQSLSSSLSSSSYSHYSGAPLHPRSSAASSSRVFSASVSTSIASSGAQRSNLSAVRYAARPEVAVRQPITVVRNPAYVPPSVADAPDEGEGEAEARPRPAGARPLRRNPSNFSRPIPPPPPHVHLRDSGVDMRRVVPGAAAPVDGATTTTK
ncbi:hypothetical protein F4809DRAFT_662836 [Biscogniauxia mediterranea]|nr:hypothetical protein F4809DRAFT_662836 [Biscogniauxia mediterranea]